ncbi:MAG: N-acetylmuramoyl-L-alanine amidase [Alphaproteobacteria bacterium]|nr:MAG: N-acetylmuramoyl-L-alanine amidase [Alphaproteobacteria bacterium]
MPPVPALGRAVRLLVLLLGGLVLPATFAAATDATDDAAPAARPPTAVVFAGRIAGDETSTRLFFDFDRPVDFSHFMMASPERLVIDSPAVLFRFAEPELIEPRGLVAGIRYGAMARDRSRIVVTLAGPARAARFEVVELEPGAKFRLVVDLVPVTADEYGDLVSRQRAVLGVSGEVVTKGDRVRVPPKPEGRFTIVIDPGHGGIDGGAEGASGIKEKDLTLAVASKIATKVAAIGPFDVKMTREEDVFVSLQERVNFARRNHADLVISIHADSLRQKWVRGATVYTLSREASDELARELAQSENMSDQIAGLDSREQQDVVNDILADLTARETAKFSRAFSTTLVRTLAGDVPLIKNPQRSAAFVVLKAPEIPSVLVELGYLSNATDEKMMADPTWEEDISAQIAKAVRSFFEARLAE